MHAQLSIFKTAYAMATHAGQRQALLAENAANADTPGYRPRDLMPFSESGSRRAFATEMRATNPKHLNGMAEQSVFRAIDRGGDAEPNQNAVSIEEEMVHAVAAKRQHDRAIAIYKSSLSILRASLGRK